MSAPPQGKQDVHHRFETYKLHTELAEQVASLREDLAKVYSGMVAGIVAVAILVHRLTPKVSDDSASVFDWMWVFPSLGILLSLGWMLSIHSITSRLAAKHSALRDFERQLKIDFLEQEEKAFVHRCSIRRQFSALFIPLILLVSCFIWLVWIVCAAR